MSLINRINDAKLLWEKNRLEGAFLNILIAVAVASRKKYPKNKYSDKEAFINFLKSFKGPKVSIEYRNKLHEIEYIFYKWLRCKLVHEGSIPIDIQFFPEDNQNGLVIRAGGAPEYVLKLSRNWFLYIFEELNEHFKNEY